MDSIWEILIAIVVLGVAIYLFIPWYKRGRDARGKKVLSEVFFQFAFILLSYICGSSW